MTIQESLTQFISNELLGGEAVEADANLLADGIVDSIGTMRLVSFVQEEFGFNVPPADVVIENFMSIDAMTAYIGRHVGE